MRKIAILAAFAAVTSASAVLAQGGTPPAGARGEGRGPGGRGGPGGFGAERVLLQGITLTDAQKDKLKALREAERAKMQEGRGQGEGRPNLEAIRDARANGDTAAVRRLIAEQRAQMEARRDADVAAVRAILTGDQLAKFDANVAEMKKRDAERGPGGFGGAGARGGRGRGARPPQR